MERMLRDEDYGNGEARGSSNFSSSPGQAAADGIHFCDGLMTGLENLPPISTAGSGHSWIPGGSDLGLGTLPHSFGGWTSYPTDDTPPYPATETVNNAGVSSPLLSSDDYFTSLSQPDSASCPESGYYATRSRSHSEHYDVLGGMSGYDFSRLGQTGHDMYAEALGQWAASSESEPRSYDLFGTTSLLQQQQQQQQQQQPEHHQDNRTQLNSDLAPNLSIPTQVPTHKPSKPQTHSATPETLKPSTKKNNKPSYSDVAKNCPPGGRGTPVKVEPEADFHNKSHKQEGFPDFIGVRSHHVHHSRSRTAKTFRPRRHPGIEPTTIKPDSRYGLDTFEEPVSSKISDHLSASSGSCPHSRKGSTSSGTGSHCGMDELDPIEHLKRSDSTESDSVNMYDTNEGQSWSGVKYDPQKGCFVADAAKEEAPEALADEVASPQMPEANHSEDGKRKTQSENEPIDGMGSKRPRSSSCPKPQQKVTTPKESVFFDPKRIFASHSKPAAKKSLPTPTRSQNCIPNNQHPQALPTQPGVQLNDTGSILNNDKPKTKSNSNINQSCYINNNLREPSTSSASTKKQSNADAQRDSGNNSSHSHGGPQSSSNHGHSGRHSTHPRHRPGSGVPPRPDPHSRDEVPSRRRRTEKKAQAELEQQYVIGDLAIQLCRWTMWAAQELGHVVWNITKLVVSLGIALFIMLGQHSLSTVKSVWVVISAKFYRRSDSDFTDSQPKKMRTPCGLKENSILPSSGDEAMKRLLGGKGKDPYSILGVRIDASDDMIKKYYRRQAVLVHPDKNQMPGAEEAFKILGHAFDLIGEPEKRKLFDSQRMEAQEEEEALHQFADLLSKLHDKMQEANNLMRCENCGNKHRRVPTERAMYAARYCQRCDYSHPVREGDVWAESHMLGFLWNYYACMETRVYDITEWASCQCDRFKHIQANAHHIVYRIATNSNSGGRNRQNANRSNDADLEDFLSHLFHQANGAATPDTGGGGDPSSQFGQFGTQRPGQQTWNSSTSTNKKGRRRKKKH